ncbi:DNA cytosine methyltransferase [Pseudomonas aeruginosa]|uniref:DNA cytosine methyltransferase n=1 Tax=Pseudomonas aeruginosa TaxID=287 RepID=UPI001A218BDE|nr:DNA cytosine methyltransferase [Pseudomonas aeruginosa]MBH3499134.1 DNA cytosine methyltransferase [Pseudomonas aeruginosa]MBV5888774.1 DNA cytosine methyltransferase [Pseudomonas aeruginosa]MDA3430841.1 DNA cytosine methyltransferase [Pseudomonas aeruginosa]MDU0508398.1 DNA cytosine methyltransferase [Pseudomonas aeruginosa]HEJ5564175.1 DNA cytosine methyltransferase [Pseudomonas aeruginosa]
MNHHQELDFCTMCSGIEAPSVALESIGFRALWFAEIEPFPSAVLAHHYPSVPNHGDMTKLIRRILTGAIEAPPLAIAGTPCQAFSVAGWREGLTDPRGALTIKFVETIDAIDLIRTRRREPECIAWWENVPGVLSDKENAFGCFLAALVGESEELQPPGGKWKDAGCVYGPKRTAAWRVLDAQYFGLAQRRRRVFVIASARAGFDPCEVLLEREGLRRDSPPSRGQGKEVTCSTAGRPGSFGPDSRWAEDWGSTAKAFGGGKNCNPTDVSTAITAHPGGRYDLDAETFVVADIPTVAATLTAQYGKSGGIPAGNDCVPVNLIAGTLQANGKAAGSATQQDAESGLLVVHGTQDPDVVQDCAHTLGRNHGQENAVFDPNQITSATNRSQPTPGLCHTLPASSQAPIAFPLLEVGKRTGRSTFDPRAGLGVGAENDPMFTLQASAQHGVCIAGEITHTLKAEGFDASEDGTGRGQPIVADVAPTLRSGNFRNHSNPATEADSLVVASAVRRLTPRECERLQGFPDDYTLIPWRGKPAEECPDGPRYKAIGNSKAVPVVRWIGRRLKAHLEKLS